jgi:hypothetical protein
MGLLYWGLIKLSPFLNYLFRGLKFYEFFLDLTKKNLSLKLKKNLGLKLFFGPYQIGGLRRVPNSPRL